MRIIIALQPTNKRGTKSAYTNFRKKLLSDGFMLVMPEVFMRITSNRKSAKIHINRISDYLPDTGVIRALLLTEKQYQNIIYLVGEADYQEKMVGGNCHISL